MFFLLDVCMSEAASGAASATTTVTALAAFNAGSRRAREGGCGAAGKLPVAL